MRSAVNGDTPVEMRRINTLKVSNIGPIRIATARAGAEKISGVLVTVTLLSSINLMAITTDIKPISSEPVSPIKILAGVILNFKKPKIAPTIASETAAS